MTTSSGPHLETAEVAIVGGGPAGLAAATELAANGAGRVLVIERETEAGGIPRHAHHQGYGLRDLHRTMTGPAYARRRVELASQAGAELRVSTQVTGWSPAGELELTGPAGRTRLRAARVLLATGCRERPRSARLVAGDRPQGVMTTGTLQQIVYLEGARPGNRALIVGAEHVSFSAMLTLAHGGAQVAGLVTSHPHHQSYALFRAGAALRYRVPLRTGTEVVEIHGRRRVQGVTLKSCTTGTTWREPCDTVVFTGDWIPDHELAVLGDIDLDAGTLGPAVDLGLRTSRPGIFAAGNVLQGAETADIAALQGRHAARQMLAHIRSGADWPARRIALEVAAPLDWLSPNALSFDSRRPRVSTPLRVRSHEELIAPLVEVRQGNTVLWRGRLVRIMPARSARLPTKWMARADPSGPAVTVRVVSARWR